MVHAERLPRSTSLCVVRPRGTPPPPWHSHHRGGGCAGRVQLVEALGAPGVKLLALHQDTSARHARQSFMYIEVEGRTTHGSVARVVVSGLVSEPRNCTSGSARPAMAKQNTMRLQGGWLASLRPPALHAPVECKVAGAFTCMCAQHARACSRLEPTEGTVFDQRPAPNERTPRCRRQAKGSSTPACRHARPQPTTHARARHMYQ